MQNHVGHWLERCLSDRTLASGGSVLAFALRLSVKTVVATNLVHAAFFILVSAFGILPDLPLDAALFGVIPTTIIAFVVTMTVGTALGCAIHDISISRDEFERLSSTDMLTGLKNRRAFFETFKATKADAVFVIFDIDHFKAINDAHGHLVGDAVITELGKVLASAFAGTKAEVARLGGEEFAALVHHVPGQDVARLVNTVLVGAEKVRIDVEDLSVTLSAGMAEVLAGRPLMDVYGAADKALYLAKASGRNRIVHESELACLTIAAGGIGAASEALPPYRALVSNA